MGCHFALFVFYKFKICADLVAFIDLLSFVKISAIVVVFFYFRCFKFSFLLFLSVMGNDYMYGLDVLIFPGFYCLFF